MSETPDRQGLLPPETEAGVAKERRLALARLLVKAREHPFAQRAASFYERHHRFAPLFFFLGGVVWDASTLRRIDAWVDNVLLITYLLLLGALLIVAALVEQNRVEQPWLHRYKVWYPAGIQFFLGALFSAFVIFYSQSASLNETSFFLVLLVVLLVANEFIHRRLANLYLLFGLYYLAVSSFFAYFIPVVVKVMSYATFLAGHLLSLLIVKGMLGYLYRKGGFEKQRHFIYALGLTVGLFGLMNLFYYQNWIPPVPLAMRDGGVYHHVEKRGEVYEVRYEKPEWYQFWVDDDQSFHYRPGEPVYCFTAIFAPTRLTQRIYHEWQYFEEKDQAWVSSDRIGYDLLGGRDNGYRGYTVKRRVRPGEWRVVVETADGRILSRIRFTIIPVDTPITNWQTEVYE